MNNNRTLIKILDNTDKYLLYLTIFLYPLFTLPIFQNLFETSRLMLLSGSLVIISLIKIIKNLFNKGLTIKTTKTDAFVACLALVYFVSSVFISPNKIDAFLLPGISSFIILGSILYFFINQLENIDKRNINVVLAFSAIIYSLMQILSFTGFVKNNLITFGNPISSVALLSLIIPIAVFEIIKGKNNISRIFFAITSFIIVISAFTTIYLLIPGKPTSPNLPDIKTSWSVSVDTLKKNPVFGAGPASFLTSYNKFRPITSNANLNWEQKYILASNTFLTVLSEVGIIGFILLGFIFALNIARLRFSNSNNDFSPYSVSILIALIIGVIYPYSASFFPILFIFFALNNKAKDLNDIFNNSRLPLFLIMLPFLGIILFGSFFAYKAFYSEYLFANTLKLISKNDAFGAYNAINKTIKSNTYVDKYHIASAEINIAIAQNLAKKENLSDDEKKTLAELIQQSIKESKAAVALDPNKASSWENMGNIYLSVSPFAKESANFAIQSYNQAIFLDPINPNLRIKLGGVYYATKDYVNAIKIFELAVLAKPDHANSRYNLAMAYKENKQFDKAKEQMNAVLKLVDPNSNDYQTAKAALDSIEKKETGKEVETSSQILTPPTSATQELEPQVQIPQE